MLSSSSIACLISASLTELKVVDTANRSFQFLRILAFSVSPIRKLLKFKTVDEKSRETEPFRRNS